MLQPYRHVEFANTLRGLACLMVVVAHYSYVFWIAPAAVASYTHLPAPPPDQLVVPGFSVLNSIPYIQWGPLGVAVFFVISGFVIPFSLTRQTFAGFCLSRALRIMPTYIVGFGITLLTVLAGCWYFGTTVPFTLPEIAIHAVPGIRDLLQSRNIDGIIWTLEIEVKFYLLCALSIAWMRRQSLNVFFIPLGFGGIALLLSTQLGSWSVNHPVWASFGTIWINLTQYLVFMYIGVVFHYIHVGALGRKGGIIAIAGLFLLTCLVWRSGPHSATVFLAINYAVAVLLFALGMKFPRVFRSNPIFDFLASISYPLYVIHGVAGYVVLHTLREFHWSPLASVAVTSVLAISVSWSIHRLVELPTQRLGKHWAKRMQRRKSQAELQHVDAVSV
ncbi:MAG: acyltransferase [Pirellulaceae bacterium]